MQTFEPLQTSADYQAEPHTADGTNKKIWLVVLGIVINVVQLHTTHGTKEENRVSSIVYFNVALSHTADNAQCKIMKLMLVIL